MVWLEEEKTRRDEGYLERERKGENGFGSWTLAFIYPWAWWGLKWDPAQLT